MTEQNEYEPIQIKQTRGPTLRFDGRLLAENTGGPVELEIYETRGGALVAVSEGEMRGGIDTRACVVEPCDDEQAMRLAVMEFFDFDNRARTMARKLGWRLVREIA